jgi:16S rRNA processing protein RimM
MTRGPDINPERRILIGRMVGAFGISGEIKCQSFADPPQQLLKYKPLILVHEGHERVLEDLKGWMIAMLPRPCLVPNCG